MGRKIQTEQDRIQLVRSRMTLIRHSDYSECGETKNSRQYKKNTKRNNIKKLSKKYASSTDKV